MGGPASGAPRTSSFIPENEADGQRVRRLTPRRLASAPLRLLRAAVGWVRFAAREGLTLVARERGSHGLMRRMLPSAGVLLCPDVVLSSTAEDFGVSPQARSGALAGLGLVVRRTDMLFDGRVTRGNLAGLVQAKMLEFASAEVVVTDRMHAMVFCALTGTPCVALGNYNHKVEGTYEWLAHLPYVEFARDMSEVAELVSKVLESGPGAYDRTPLEPYFEALAGACRSLILEAR